MKFLTPTLFAAATLIFLVQKVCPADSSDALFSAPSRGFISSAPAANWEHGILTGNGTIGALVMGNPHDETLFLNHASLYLPNSDESGPIDMASRLDAIRKLCLAGKYAEAGTQIDDSRKAASFTVQRDPFIGALALHVKQAESPVKRYQRAVDFMTAETIVSVEDGQGGFQRRAFASRTDGVIVLLLSGGGKRTAEISFGAIPPADEKEQLMISDGVKSSEQGVKDGLLYFRTLFAHKNRFNPNIGYEAVGKVIAKGGTRNETATGIDLADAEDVLVLVKIQPLLKADNRETNFASLADKINALPVDYATLLAPHAKLHGDLIGRVSLSLNAPADDRSKPNEQLNKDSASLEAPLAKIERAFDAGRYNIICCTGYNPPNLQGLWAGTWSAPWSGSFTTNGNLPTAVAFLLMGNTPELMHGYFRYHDERWSGFHENVRTFFGGMRGFHIPPQITVSPLETDFNSRFPHCFSHASTPWTLQFYYDYFQYTGDRKFLAEHAYPLMKEACGFYEDFLSVEDKDGKVVFVPNYSPENGPWGQRGVTTSINATIDGAAAKQLLGNTIAAAKLLGIDHGLQAKWAALVAKLPDYQVAEDGSFREWLWPGLPQSHLHRHASHLYPLYDAMPAEIVQNPALVNAVDVTIQKKLEFRQTYTGMAFGIVQIGLAAEHIGNATEAQQAIEMLAKGFWSNGMASFHDAGHLFNMDISGGFPYLCASSLVYADPGHIRLFPALPSHWKSGSLRGVRLRGGIVVRELAWGGQNSKLVLLSDTYQTVTVETPDRKTVSVKLRAGEANEQRLH